jgi:hypothetical protein
VTSAEDTSDGGGGLGHDDDAMNIMSGLDDAMNMEDSDIEISKSKPLSELPMNEVERLLQSSELDEYKAVFVKELGRSLTVKEMGIYGMQHSSL